MPDQAQWTQVVEQAVRAPSIHNTQPWTFTAAGDRLEVRRDSSRALPAIDPTGRQQVLSCGVAVHFAVVALRAAGFATDVDLVPDPADPEHLATVRVVGPAEPSASDVRLAAAIDARHTDRAPFLAEPLPAGLVDRLQAEAGRDGVWLKPISRVEEEAAVAVLLDQGEQQELRDPAYLAELQAWTRTDPEAPDGVPVAALPTEGRATNFAVRDFAGGGGPHDVPATPADDDPPPPVEHPSVVLLGTAADDRAAWVQAGTALGRLLLSITDAGLAASPLTQALDQGWVRNRLTARLDLVGHPQMMLRLGRPSGEQVTTGRRPVAEVLQVG
ncbi:hypothetical protein O2W16_17815 [Modestobacter sp. VKM Ac-2984]|nr:hypothetical protein [Modestobacter sp. VKM Ac-2984]MCZ2817962.1 hypothetical protein [Modestobacter sp. VKM Ac-2984]